MLGEDGLTRSTLERRSSAQQLVQHHTERVDVGLLGDRSLLDLFGREVLGRRLHVDQPLHLARIAQARQLEVEQLQVTVFEHDHVARRDGAVDESHVVQGLDGSAEFERQS